MSDKNQGFAENPTLAVIGLGYVGLPLAATFGTILPTIGFDIDPERLASLRCGEDSNREATKEELAAARQLRLTGTIADLKEVDVFIVTVPTPLDQVNMPDLGPLRDASAMIGSVMKPGAIVIYESTVYPGTVEEVCVPILEAESKRIYNDGFFVGYSPERINPGDKTRRLPDILKITAGSTPEVADYVDALYNRIIRAGTHKAPSIRVAEAAKVIENTQRNVSIALVNELAMLFNELGIDTQDVLEAAGTKWNFPKLSPGLVGGHCIGVDPYYLTYKAQSVGFHSELVLVGQRINDRMSRYVASRIIKEMVHRRILIHEARVLVMGLTFKENCPDMRNTKVIEMIEELESHGVHQVDVWDPYADADKAYASYCRDIARPEAAQQYDVLVLAVAHDMFKKLSAEDLQAFCKPQRLIYDLKKIAPDGVADVRL